MSLESEMEFLENLHSYFIESTDTTIYNLVFIH